MADYRSTLAKKFADVRLKKQRYLEGIKDPIVPANPFANSNPRHAAQLIDVLVDESMRWLDILARQLGSRTHSATHLRDQVSRYPGLQVRILIEGDSIGPIYSTGEIDLDSLTQSALVDLVPKTSDADAAVIAQDGKAAPGRIAVRVLPVRSEVHFVVSDRFGYRLEVKHDTAEGTGKEMDPKTAETLVEKFDALWELGIPARFSRTQRFAA